MRPVDWLRAQGAQGDVLDGLSRFDDWASIWAGCPRGDWLLGIAERLARYRSPSGPFVQQLDDGRWLQVSERKIEEIGTVAVYTDITSLKEAEQGRFQAFFIVWSGRIDPDGNSYIFHRCKAPQNNGNFCDKDVDQWLDDSRKVSKLEERKPIYEKIAEKYLTEGSIIYLYHRLVIIAHSTRLEGYNQLPDGLVRVVGVTLKP